MDNSPIGIIDSGVGGLTIASVLAKKLPNESIIYLADCANCPYGGKTPEEIYKLSKKMIDLLLKRGAKLLVVACNTITVTCIGRLRKDYPSSPIVGIVPVIKTASERTRSGKIGVFSTQTTAESRYQKDLIEKFAKEREVINVGSSDLVPLIEARNFEGIDQVLPRELEPFISSGIDTLALGCSHFPLIKEKIQKILPHVLILDSSEAVCRQAGRILANNVILAKESSPKYSFLTTGDAGDINYFIRELFGRSHKAERIIL